MRDYLRRVRGHHQRQVERWKHTRWLGTILLNVNRGDGEPAIMPGEAFPLPGDEWLDKAVLNLDQYTAALSRLDDLDADLAA